MKSAMLMYFSVFMLVFEVMFLASMIMRSSYMDVLQDNLDSSIEYSVALLQQDMAKGLSTQKTQGYLGSTVPESEDFKGYSGSLTGDSFKDDFVAYLTKNLNSRVTKLDIDILGADEEKGVLSVDVRAYYEYSNGREDFVESYKTVILNKVKK